ncbi:DUF397 domain-containing protein [Actinomadura formosensis]|uniref:DUF397 domain-containing protein n=1 Tax=Actinomadura formosensis TaxID=60706 RepID=UPI003D916A75
MTPSARSTAGIARTGLAGHATRLLRAHAHRSQTNRDSKTLEPLKFRKSSRCAELNQDGCVEVACGRGYFIVRDSKDPNGLALCMPIAVWRNIARAIRTNATFMQASKREIGIAVNDTNHARSTH